jgi:hypothetical protein
MFDVSSSWSQPSLTIRPAIQSVSVMMSRLIGWQSPSWLATLAKNSLLSLMSAL